MDRCLCPVCKEHYIPMRCKAFQNTCPAPPEPSACTLRGLHARMMLDGDYVLGQGERVVFNGIVENHGRLVDYSRETGLFLLRENALYLVNWSIAVEGCGFRPFVNFALSVNGGIHSEAAMPITIGALSGSALVRAAANSRLALVNNTGDRVRLYGAGGAVANLTIVGC